MAKLQVISDYKDNDFYRDCLNRLLQSVFGFSLEKWYSYGYWDNKYIPFSYFDGTDIIANASASKIDLVINRKSIHAIQIGTVMTDKNYRKRGLASELIKHIIDEFKNQTDLFFLFCEEHNINFYRNLGFNPIQETQYSLDISQVNYFSSKSLVKLDVSSDKDRELILNKYKSRLPLSDRCRVDDAAWIFMFHMIGTYRNSIYFDRDNDSIIISRQTPDITHIYDIIANSELDYNKLFSICINENTKKIVFHFTPDLHKYDYVTEPFNAQDDILCVSSKNVFKNEFMFPRLAQA